MRAKKTNQAVALSSAIAVLLVSGFSTQAYANQMDTLLLPDKDRSNAEFDGVRFITIRYAQGSALAEIFFDNVKVYANK